ncbi:anthranilate synthase component I [Archaeoglobus fulgidus]|uniref:Anthranilate synthase component 1 n=1 Tax=Archaeoglobus fulgidus DSM 8774 TaxID=1344584 RepID=A0A075WM67_ARCFL|nr:anthranilate synthase component I [Archaeoglobus fulgidus]AIG98608.1 anthranilate synthase component I, archaeal clade [Archaeoglobus fulgidus DSM 8774]
MQKHEYVDPVKLYSAIRDEKFPFILESAEKSGRARYTYISFNPLYTVRVGSRTRVDGEAISKISDPFDALNEIHVKGLLVGYVAYEAVKNYIGKKPQTPSVFGCYDGYFVYDHYLRKLFSVNVENADKIVERAKRVEVERVRGNSEVLRAGSREKFEKMVERGKEQIFEGEVYQIVLSREYVVDTDLSPFQMYLNLRETNPSPYMFLLEFDRSLVGSSPETMGRVEGSSFIINPIAGTARREAGREKEIAEKLLSDEKERAEHVMLVDLARNDVRKVCRAGSVRVSRFMEVVEYPSVLHIESEVVGELKAGVTHFDAMKATFPAGTVTGAPKLRAIELIDEIEGDCRGVYAGAVGYFSENVSDLAIAIRMIEFDGKARIRAGAGIVADSVPEREFFETENKIARVLRAVGL